MPELPEVETVCRGLAPVLTGQKILHVDLHRADLRKPFPVNLKKILIGAIVTSIQRRAKYILVELNKDFTLILHLGMSGRILVTKFSGKPGKHDHMVLHLKNRQAVVFNDPRRFGLVDVAKTSELDQHPYFIHLGPEPLSRQFSALVLAKALREKKVPIKIALMDQRVVVGVGNIYASESLFLAGIDPATQAGLVSRSEEKMESLVRAVKTVLKKAIQSGGSTLRDHRQTNGELGYFQHHFAVYNREGQACPGCYCDIAKTKGIKRIIQGGRSTFYCPRKQA